LLRLGYPEFRLSRYVLDKEIDYILGLGVTGTNNMTLGLDFNADKSKTDGYKRYSWLWAARRRSPECSRRFTWREFTRQ